MATLDAIRVLLDVEAIKRLKARYFRLMDEKRWEEWVEVFAEDVVVAFPDDLPGAPPVRGRAAVVATVSRALAEARTVHHGHMPEIELTSATTARGTWAMHDVVEIRQPDGTTRGFRGYGHYFEEYVKDGEHWRIASLELRRLRRDPL